MKKQITSCMILGMTICTSTLWCDAMMEDVKHLGEAVVTDTGKIVVDIQQETPGLIRTLIHLPIDVVTGVLSLTSAGAGYILLGGSKVVENSGVLLTKVGDVGSYIIATSQEHRVATGLIGLAAVGTLLAGTDAGRYVMQRVYRSMQVLLGLDEESDCDSCKEHRTIALYLNQ